MVPLWFSADDLNRIIPWLVRKGHRFGVAYERRLADAGRLTAALQEAAILVCFSPDVAEEARQRRFTGEIGLFSHQSMLAWPEWFRDLAVRPITATCPAWETADDLSPIFLVTTKSCIAEIGACRSRNGRIQYPVACDNRCREKTRERLSVTAPLSIAPVSRFPEGASAIFSYDEHLLAGIGGTTARRETFSEELSALWNHLFPIGRRIITEGHRTGETRFYFNLSDESYALWEAHAIRFWAYHRNLYDGWWADGAKVVRSKRRLLVTLQKKEKKVVMVQSRDDREHEELKRARHQIYTMPPALLFSDVDETILRQEEETLPSVAPRRMTLVLDDLDRRAFFRAPDVARVALLYTGGLVSRFFDHYLYLPFLPEKEELRTLIAHRRLRGFVVQDRFLRRMLETLCRGEKEVFLHPAFLEPEEPGPSCIVTCEQVFRSPYRVSGRALKGWNDLRISPYPLKQGTLFLRNAPWSRTGDLPEIWVDLIGADAAAVRAVKVRAERALRGK